MASAPTGSAHHHPSAKCALTPTSSARGKIGTDPGLHSIGFERLTAEFSSRPLFEIRERWHDQEREHRQRDANDRAIRFLAAVLGAADTVRPEVPAALDELRALGMKRIELLTGDNERAVAALAGPLGIDYQANLLPEDKIAVVALMREDWTLVPEVFRIAKRTMRVVKLNIGFTGVYNVVGLGLAAFGIIPPIMAAAAQSFPDVGILANSLRLLRQPARTPDGGGI